MIGHAHMNRFKYFCLRYRPYFICAIFFLAIFAIWGIGCALGFRSLDSLLAGIGMFLLLSAGYVLLLYRAPPLLDRDLRQQEGAQRTQLGADAENREEIQQLRDRLLPGFKQSCAIKDGHPAPPCYLIIGQSGAGKSSLVEQSGLSFDGGMDDSVAIADRSAANDCACYIGAEAVLLDSAGCYMDNPAQVGKWRALLQLLREHRPHRPLNGLIVVVGIGDLLHGSSEAQERTARRLRQRIQQCNGLLEMRLPIYLVFSQCDLLPGFGPFCHDGHDDPRAAVMGKTFSHKGYALADWPQRFDGALDEVVAYWQQVAHQRLVRQNIEVTRGNDAAYRFPVELAALKPRLKQFVGDLMQTTPYQPAELLRGFYFTAARDAGETSPGRHEQRVAERFALQSRPLHATEVSKPAPRFIEGLLRQVIIPDQHLVTLYSRNHRQRRRKRTQIAAASLVATLLCSVWGWSWHNNTATLQQLSADLALAASADQRVKDAYTAWHSLDRLRSWASDYHRQHHQEGVPLRMGFGLYQGYRVEPLLRAEYFTRLRQVMLEPVADNLTRTLYQLPTLKVYQRNTPRLAPVTAVDSVEASALPQDNRAQSIADFGKATLDTYAMLSLAHRDKADPVFLNARLPDYWYPAIARHTGQSMATPDAPRDYLYASRQIEFYSEQVHAADAPRILDNAFLISSSRNYIDSLRSHSLRTIETITLESDTLFAFGRADFQGLASAGRHQLNAIASKLLGTADVDRIVISGHADPLGDPQGNLAVSRQRAHTIRTYLIGKGIPKDRVSAHGLGSSKPLVHCDRQLSRTELIKCFEPNRRVEIVVRSVDRGHAEEQAGRGSRETRPAQNNLY